MSLLNTGQISSQLLPDNDLQPEKFLNTCLQEQPNSGFYDASDFTTLSRIKFGGISLLNLPSFFGNWSYCYTKDQHLCKWWDSTNLKCQYLIVNRVKLLYKYKKMMEPLNGYTNMKEYLVRALDRNIFLWNQLVLVCMDDAAKNVSGPEGNTKSEIKMMCMTNPSHLHLEHTLKYVQEVSNCLEKMNWLKSLNEYLNTTAFLLEYVKQILQSLELLPMI